MRRKVNLNNFANEILREFENDSEKMRTKLADSIDNNIIAKNFDGFPEHAVSEKYARTKKTNRVGEESGRLKKSATSFTKWSLYSHRSGTRSFLLRKKRAGITPYSHLVRTLVGGDIDFLRIGADDISNINTFIKPILISLNYKGSGRINLIIKSVSVKERKKPRELDHEIINVRGIRSYVEMKKGKKGRKIGNRSNSNNNSRN